MPHVWYGGGFKKLPKSSFQKNFFQNGTQFNKLLYHWTQTTAINKLITVLMLFLQSGHLAGYSCNGVHRLVQWCRSFGNVRWTGTESQSRFLAFLCKLRHFTLHTLTGRSSKSLTVYKHLKKYQHMHVQHRKSTFALECESPRMRMWKPDLITQKDKHAM